MADSVFRAPLTQSSDTPLPTGIEATSGGEVDVQVPYLDYEDSAGHPYIVEYFNLGDSWSDPIGGFPKELGIIEDYIQEKVDSREIANSVGAIKDLLKGLEKMTNVSKEERSLIKVETIAAYVEFLMKTDTIKHNLRKYGNV